MKNKNIGWQRILLLIIPYLIVVSIFQFIGALISGVDLMNFESPKTSFQMLVLSFFGLVGTFFILWLFMKYLDKERFINLGFEIKGRFKEIKIGIGIGLLTMTIGYSLLEFIGEITFQRINFKLNEALISVLLFITIAIVEETLMRGYILKNLMISFNKYIALILTSILFALMHGLNPSFDLFALTSLFLAGILLGLSYVYTKNLWFPIALHLSWNLFQALLGFNVSGKDTYSLIEFDLERNNLLNGGEFGFEGSILSIISMTAIIIGIWIYYNRERTKPDQLQTPQSSISDYPNL